MAPSAAGPVLIVDDEPDVREAFAMLLGLKGYQVVEAPNGQAALDAMHRQRPAAVLLDLTMPVMDGWTLRRLMKEDPVLTDVPIIVVSGVADVGPELVGCAVLKKPVDSDRLGRPGPVHGDRLTARSTRLPARHAMQGRVGPGGQ